MEFIPTAEEFFYCILEDTDIKGKNYSYNGESLEDFVLGNGISPDTPIDEINEILIENDIKPIEY
jgi:hypothetical protein